MAKRKGDRGKKLKIAASYKDALDAFLRTPPPKKKAKKKGK